MQMIDMYIDAEEKSKGKRLAKIGKTVTFVLWVLMIVIAVFLTSRSVVVIN
ncbi:MAG: hypothetical protein HDR03_03880 [Lachnospiraceae bacterium]|nr:hypothetical protein [Lachnospiraceae bacterium]